MTDYLRSISAYVATRHYASIPADRPGHPSKPTPTSADTPADSAAALVDTPEDKGWTR
ncbi:hypothetical protein [Nocardia macrotermitis]|uniref:Uncharacterized protein n=1 Tax=Nocardia macrotermitis TaxID=2585198 RepID=A0A7K0DAY5_9NOCA|nr:hypothetical protein [Nocardia macrotermitis]MQY22681.1 hypothetical protein [Nocardia macrotermitis]